MPRPKPTAEDLKTRKLLAKTFKVFRKEYKLTQRKLEDELDISRRTIQMIEGAKITPHARTITRFQIIKNKYESGNF